MGRPGSQKQLLSEDVRVQLKGHVVRSLLRRQNQSLRTFAQAIDINPNHAWQLVSKHRNPSPDMRKKIMDYFPGQTWDDLFEEVRQ